MEEKYNYYSIPMNTCRRNEGNRKITIGTLQLIAAGKKY